MTLSQSVSQSVSLDDKEVLLATDWLTDCRAVMFTEEPSKAALKNKKKREAKARRKLEEQQQAAAEADAGDDGLSWQMHTTSLNWLSILNFSFCCWR